MRAAVLPFGRHRQLDLLDAIDADERSSSDLAKRRNDRCEVCRRPLDEQEPGWLHGRCFDPVPAPPVSHIDPTADRGPWSAGELLDLVEDDDEDHSDPEPAA